MITCISCTMNTFLYLSVTCLFFRSELFQGFYIFLFWLYIFMYSSCNILVTLREGQAITSKGWWWRAWSRGKYLKAIALGRPNLLYSQQYYPCCPAHCSIQEQEAVTRRILPNRGYDIKIKDRNKEHQLHVWLLDMDRLRVFRCLMQRLPIRRMIIIRTYRAR